MGPYGVSMGPDGVPVGPSVLLWDLYGSPWLPMRLYGSGGAELTLELTPEELRPLVTPAEELRAPPPLPELPEEVELPPVGVASLRRLALEGAGRPEGAELGGLLPSSAPRKLWARLFRVCLDLCAAGWLRLEQSRPFGPINIRLGPRGPAHPSPGPARTE
ncbi:meiotic recombination protein REC8 homolog [Lagopus leucura]|uniref:meiotic recombination protein REC8 homolog n=1 Tax=Lagopus leucura TaxID=30410 RepID=UPI001C6833C6|nr:meiotic recombination protein REC8 homolog [Lagopus leucura]